MTPEWCVLLTTAMICGTVIFGLVCLGRNLRLVAGELAPVLHALKEWLERRCR
jgi:hypothetical protein